MIQNNELDLYPLSMNSFKKIFIEAINMEALVRETAADKQLLLNNILSYSSIIKIHTAFTKQGIEKISSMIFRYETKEEESFRDFFLSLCDTFFIMIEGQISKQGNNSNYEYLAKLLSSLDRRRLTEGYPDFTSMDKNLYDRIYKDRHPRSRLLPSTNNESSESTLLINDWLIIVLMMVISNVELTKMFSEVQFKP